MAKHSWIKKWKPVSDIGKAAKRGTMAKQSWRNTELVGDPIINTDAHLKGDRNMVRQACLWALWDARRSGLIPADISHFGNFTCSIVPAGVHIQRGKIIDIVVAMPDWPDLDETNVTIEEIQEAA